MGPLNESGSPVDWWFLYKVPKLAQSPHSAIATGYEYAYYDDVSQNVVKSSYVLDTDHGALRTTLDALFGDVSPSNGWILYNDERPNGADNGNLGHTKGVIGFDLVDKTAFWLLHSWPKYADPGAQSMPTPMYGQTFICIALTLDNARELARQMMVYQQPQVYGAQLPPGLPVDDPIALLNTSVTATDPGGSSTIQLTSRGGLSFKVIAKNRLWNQDFWNDLVGPTLQEDINVETWIRGAIPPTGDSDHLHVTLDIKCITLQQIGMPWAWPETRDHAKWAISHANNWVCVGDINRMITQEKRGGCTIAFQDPTLWDLLNKTDLLVLPPGWSTAHALQVIQSTHAPSALPSNEADARS